MELTEEDVEILTDWASAVSEIEMSNAKRASEIEGLLIDKKGYLVADKNQEVDLEDDEDEHD